MVRVAGFVNLPGTDLDGKPIYVRDAKAAAPSRVVKNSPAETDAAGNVHAIVATLQVIDHVGDVVMPGAIAHPQRVSISSWNHGSYDAGAGALPCGVGEITEENGQLVMRGKLLMKTQVARDLFEYLRAAAGLVEWSWGYSVLRQHPGSFKGESVNFLDSVEIRECSPVLQAASIGTSTTHLSSMADHNLAADASLRLNREPLARSRKAARRVEMLLAEAEGLGVKVPKLAGRK